MPKATAAHSDPFYAAFRGSFSSLLTWESLDVFWNVLRAKADAGWHIYAIGMPAPIEACAAGQVHRFISAVDVLLRREHHEDYCGIVYADSKDNPTFVKIFDPCHLGVSCGSSKNPPMPGWIMSLLPPAPLEDKRVLPMGRQRWWQELCSP